MPDIPISGVESTPERLPVPTGNGGNLRIPDAPNTFLAAVATRLLPKLAPLIPVQIADAIVTGQPRIEPGTPIITINRQKAFYRRLVSAGLIGFCESYQAGDWDTDDLPLLLTGLLGYSDGLVWTAARRTRSYLGRLLPDENTIAGARQNVSYHYDISNDFFACFLDDSMTYSAALFREDSAGRPIAEADLLLEAQQRKIDRLLDLTGVGDGTRLLEIGTGWGYLAIRAAQRGARVRTITISTEQFEYSRRLVMEAGMDHRVAVELRDYRELDGNAEKYDAVISVEMLEAIGEQHWSGYFALLDHVLAPGGRIGLQVMTMRHDRFLAARRRRSWVNRYVLPGFLMPSVPALERAVSGNSSLKVLDRKAFGPHFAATLGLWREKFESQTQTIESLGFDEIFRRTWLFFLAGCEVNFRTGICDLYHYILGRTWSGS